MRTADMTVIMICQSKPNHNYSDVRLSEVEAYLITKEVFRIQIPFVRLSEVEACVQYPTIQENWNLYFKKLEFIFNSGLGQ